MNKYFFLLLLFCLVPGVLGALSDGLTHYYKSDVQDVFEDLVGSNDGAESGTVTRAPGKINYSQSYDGGAADDWWNVGDLGITKDFSIAMWVNSTSQASCGNGWCTVFGDDDGVDSQIAAWRIDDDGAGDFLKICGDNDEGGSVEFVFNGKWHLLVLTRNDTHLKTYTNYSYTYETANPNNPLDCVTNNDYVIGGRGTRGISLELGEFAGRIDEVAIWNRALSHDEVAELWNNSYGVNYDYINQVLTPSLSWVYPANNTRNNTVPVGLSWSVATAGCDYAELFNGSAFLLNTSGAVAVGQQYTFNYTGADGDYEFFVDCVAGGARVNTSVLFYEQDTAAPIITFVWPAAENTSVVNAGAAVTFSYSAADNNLDGCNFSVINTTGQLWLHNITDNLTASPYAFNRSATLAAWGNYSVNIMCWDDHNALVSDVQRARVAEYDKVLLGGGVRLSGYHNNIYLTSDRVGVDLEFNGESWSQKLVMPKDIRLDETVILTVRADQPLRRRYSGHKAHLISGFNYIDFDGIPGDISLVRVSDFEYLVYWRIQQLSSVFKGFSIGELNIVYASATVRANYVPNITIPNIYVNTTGLWSLDVNVTDLDSITHTWDINITLLSIDPVSGVLSHSPQWSQNGTYSVRVNVSDGVGTGEAVFLYTINITGAPAPVPHNSADITQFSNIPQALFFMFLLVFWFMLVIALFTVRGRHGELVQIFNVLQVVFGITAGLIWINLVFTIGFAVLFVSLGILVGLALK